MVVRDLWWRGATRDDLRDELSALMGALVEHWVAIWRGQVASPGA